MDPHLRLFSFDDDLLEDPAICRCLVGRLLYLTISRPDITFAVRKLNQFVSKPCKVHLAAVHDLLRYLKSSPGQGIFLPVQTFRIRAFAEAPKKTNCGLFL